MIKSVYLHIPFCLSKCRYCGFNSAPAPSAEEVERYCRALRLEILSRGKGTAGLETAYLGGGTPTVLMADQLSGVMSTLREVAVVNQGAELTIEANPETVDSEKLRALRDMGFNRLSLGVQSFDDEALKILGRAHDGKGALRAFWSARKAGFGNIGIDLIYGLPGHDLPRWKVELAKAIELGPEHVSAYSLSYEPGTEFTAWRDSGRISPCDEDLEAGMFLAAREMLGGAGFEHYEVSNFAKPGYRSRHNLNYWRCGDYLGLGAGAHSHLGGKRWANSEPYAEYAEGIEKNGSAGCFEESLNREQRLFEAVFLGLRMTEGIDTGDFRSAWGMSPLEYKPEAWAGLEREGLLLVEQNSARLTEKGMLISDWCLARFAP